MLCQFIFKNFKSYRDETVLDLQATPIAEHSDSLLGSEKDRKGFLPVSVIYGPNAGGKSGVLEALASLVSHVMVPIEYMRKESRQSLSMRHSACPPFAFDGSSKDAPTEFVVFFRHRGIEFRYAIGLCKGEVVSESLHRKNVGGKNSAKLFERGPSGIRLGASLNKKTINKDVNPRMPYISFLAINYSIEQINSAVDWFSNCIIVNYASPYALDTMPLIPEMKDSLLRALHDVDISISDYRVEYGKEGMGGAEAVGSIRVAREIDGEDYTLDIFEESRGTVKLFGLLQLALVSLAGGRLLVVDELDAIVHPKLLRYIVKLFKDKSINKSGAQLVFTSHDVSTMKNDVFRRDEIWFAAKDGCGASEIYSLYDVRDEDGSHIKSAAPFDKQYLDGRYGADPYLSYMLSAKWGA